MSDRRDDPVNDPADVIRRAFSLLSFKHPAHSALDALLAVGERDKAEIARLEISRADLYREHCELILAGERDRRQIERLTEALERLLDCRGAANGTVSRRGGEPAVCRECAAAARAVLAGEDDAGNG